MDLLPRKTNVITPSRKRKKYSMISNSVPDNSDLLLQLQMCDMNAGVAVLSSITTRRTLAPMGSDQALEAS